MDIRSFFKPVAGTSNKSNTNTQKKRPLVADSSDEDVIEVTPVKQPKKEKKPAKRKKVISSDSEDDVKTNKQKHKSPSKINAADVFGSTPIKQTKVEKKEESKQTEIKIHDDPDFEKTLMEIDEDLLLEKANALDKTIDQALDKTPKKAKKTPNKKQTDWDDYEADPDVDPDQERHEKKRYCAMQYQKYLNRSGPVHHGEKKYPNGKPDCLKNLCFLRTGVLDSLESSEFDDLIKKHGGRTVHAVSKKVNYLVIGEDPGPSKMDKARSYNIPFISEDELLDLILTKSGMEPKYAVKKDTDQRSKTPEKSQIVDEAKNKKISPENKEPLKDKLKDKKTPPKPVKELKQSLKDKLESKTIHSKTTKEVKDVKTKTDKPQVTIESKSQSLENDFKRITIDENKAWTEKYKPSNIKSIIGQQGDKSNMKKLLIWLQNWEKNHGGKTKTKLIKPSPWAKNDDGSYFKCVLLSGPPGVGKTTTATLVAKELGYDIVEFNASDTRSKKLLHEEVSQLLSTTSLAGYFKGGSAPTKKHVLLMDEVDGMAGNEDRGGIQELINLIKNSNIPIICMCNDRNHQKIRSLANYCFDLRFTKPRVEQIRGAMMSICYKENLSISAEALTEIITGTGMDIRQTLNHLSLWTANNKNLSSETAGNEAKVAKKDTVIGPWEVIRKVFSADDHKTMNLAKKSELFFYDYSIAPLFVQENYLQVVPHCPKKQVFDRIAKTADSISMGDLVDRKIRNGNNWSLLPVQAIYASVLPGFYLEGHFGGQINFPGWLGKNSKRGKFQRLLSELQAHMRTSISGSRMSVNLDYIYHIRNSIIRPLVKEGNNGISKSIEVMNSYNLLREDLDGLLELTQWPKQRDPMAMVDSKVKAAFTRAYNKNVMLPYAVLTGVKKKTNATYEDDLYGENDDEVNGEDEDDIANDGMIVAKKPSKAAEKKTSGVEKKPGRGRGKKK